MSTPKGLYYCIVIGAGSRGNVYSQHSRIRPIGVIDPYEEARNKFIDKYNISKNMEFKNISDLPPFDSLRTNDGDIYTKENVIIFVTTVDSLHIDCCKELVLKGYKRVLLEKPMATNESDCMEITKLFEENNVICGVCHVLRGTYSNRKIKSLLSKNKIGKVISCRHLEPVGHIHYSHSFVRGNWHNEKNSTNFLLAKCCHDLDLVYWWFGEKTEILSIYSQGSLEYFNKSNKPKEVGEIKRCLECPLVNTCIYSGKHPKHHYKYTDEILKDTNYGQCVYESDNDVCDNQTVVIKYRNGPTVDFHSISTSNRECERSTEIYGSEGQIVSNKVNEVIYTDYNTRESYTYNIDTDKELSIDIHSISNMKGHGGADGLFLDQFLDSLDNNILPSTSPNVTINSHMMAFNAEKSRKMGQVMYFG